MRITSTHLIEQSAAATSSAQARYATAASQVSSGLKVAMPSDDPTAWLAAHRANLRTALVDGTSQAVQYGRERLAQTDGALASIQSIVSDVRMLAVQGSNASYNPTSRAELGTQVRGLFESAIGAANTQSPDGAYILAGSASLVPPFDATGTYVGDAATRDVATEDNATHATSIAGSELTSTGGVDVMTLLSRVATALSNNDLPGIRSSLDDLTTAIHQVGGVRTRVDGMMHVLDDVKTAHDALHQTLVTAASNYVDADIVTAASNLAQAGQALDVAQTVSSHVIAMVKAQST